MKIYCLTMRLNLLTAGGAGSENDLLFRTLQNLGNEVTVITVYSGLNKISDPLPYRLIQEQITTTKQLGIQLNIFKILRKYSNDADVFHVDGQNFLYGAGAYRLLKGKNPVAAFFNRESIAWPENVSTYLPKANAQPLYKRLKKRFRFYIERYFMIPVANYIDFFEFTNPYLEQSYNEFGLKTKKRSLSIGDLFNWPELMQKFSITEETYRRRNKANGPFTILYVGRMVPGKGFDLLITAFSKIKKKDNFHVILVGSGSEEEPLRQLVHKFKLEQHFTFTGYVPLQQLYDKYFLKADIFIQPRWRRDLSSMSLITAMTFGIPSILPEGGGLAWMAKKSALYFADNDPADLAEKIEELAGNYSLRAEISSECYKRLKEDELRHKNRVELINQELKRLTKK